jgi:Replication protein
MSNYPTISGVVDIPPARPFLLDTLAQLATHSNQEKIPYQTPLEKRAKSKIITGYFLDSLTLLHDSPMIQSYMNSTECCTNLKQEDDIITGKYCNARWCIVCNRIRTAKLIRQYSEPLRILEDKQFVTLTIPNVSGDILPESVNKMYDAITRIRKNLTKTYKMKMEGIRKFECTFNPVRRDFHPHYHMILAGGKDVAENVINLWLAQFPEANIKGQDYRIADDNSIIETFKYFTKLLPSQKDKTANSKVSPYALDTIFRAMSGKRVFQSIGIKGAKEEKEEENLELVAQKYENIEEKITNWVWVNNDWFDSESGEGLTNYEPSEQIKKLRNKILLPDEVPKAEPLRWREGLIGIQNFKYEINKAKPSFKMVKPVFKQLDIF